MIALDTNVLVRVLVEDDPDQSSRAQRLVEEAVTRGEDVFIGDIVLCEFVWVLQRAYQLRRPEIVEALRTLRGLRHIVFDSTARIDAAIDRYAQGRGDLADQLILSHATEAGAAALHTFDRLLLEGPEFLQP